jgi:hypothetical protein
MKKNKKLKNWKPYLDAVHITNTAKAVKEKLIESGHLEVENFKLHHIGRTYFIQSAIYDTKHPIPPDVITVKKLIKYHFSCDDLMTQIAEILKSDEHSRSRPNKKKVASI